MDRHRVDLMAINETWLRDGEEGRAPHVPGYRLRHIPRPLTVRSRGGGVGFYIRDGLTVRVLAHPENELVEQMWVKILIRGKTVVIGTAYRPPWLAADLFFNALTESVTSFLWSDNILLAGDFNIDFLNKGHTNYRKLCDFLTTTNLSQLVITPTHFTDTSETLLDLLCTNTTVLNVHVDYIAALSSHAFISCVLGIERDKPTPKWIVYRPLKNINKNINNHFNESLTLLDWDFILSLQNVDEIVAVYSGYVLALFDKHASKKVIHIKSKQPPWITYNIKLMMRRRDEAQRRSRKTKQPGHTTFYTDLKKYVNSALTREKHAFFETFVNSNVNKPRTLWRHVKELVKVKSNKDCIIPPHLCDANQLNAHFLDVPGQKMAPLSNLTFYEFHRLSDVTFELETVSVGEVAKVLNSLKSQAVGVDDISLDMLKMVASETLPHLTHIINRSIETNTFPSIWQQALVKPIPKNGNPLDVRDLRPISILPCMSKILEKIVHMQVSKYLEVNKILPEMQSGFRRHRSTVGGLIDVVDNIITSQDKGMGTLLALLDYSRAFDSINIPLLLSKLSYYGFSRSTIAWFDSYLKNRSQIVVVAKEDGSQCFSQCSAVERGVPQGSILGPLLFILYSADIVKCINYSNYHLYADDIQVYISFHPSETQQAIAKFNSDLECISSWSDKNTLVLNPSKSKYLILGSTSQVKRIEQNIPLVRIKDKAIERVTEARNLGVIFDESLHFEKHVNTTIANCFYRLKLLYRIRPYLSTQLRVRLCEALVLSKLNYADVVYGPRLLKRSKLAVQRVQNACVRYCWDVPPRTHITPYLVKERILNMENRRRLHLACLLFDVIVYKYPLYLYNKLSWMGEGNTQHGTRSHLRKLCLPRFYTAAFRGSFKYSASKCWNNLPPPLLEALTATSFKRKYKLLLVAEFCSQS
ncbi:unnamed protein product [Euphydryas editha]|uniref:Reverse transcriptase domain-containing protein n=1 Tax=Euphydryas editha TaxID=104508 RepID=A0AAU9UBD5_EUPED|nr:unnamed protein product [Euphydryas editha]